MSLRRDALMWAHMADEARKKAPTDNHKDAVLQVADLCDHISASMERIIDIMHATCPCNCDKCIVDTPNILQ